LDLLGWRWSPDELQVQAVRPIQDSDGALRTSEIWMGTRDRRDSLPGSWIRPIPLSLVPMQFSPTVTGDGLVLYYEDYRMGSSSIYRAARKTRQDSFGDPVFVSKGGSPYVLSSGKVLYYD